VSVSDTLGTALDVTPTTSNGRLFHLFGSEIGTAARVEVSSDDSTTSRVFFPVSESATGDLSGVVAVDSTGRRVVVELYAEADRNEPSYRTRPGPDGRFVFTGLPGGGTYLLRAFADANDDGRWNAGSLEPFTAAEPIGWTLVQEPVRPRWETVVPDTLNIFE
jgi:hypothetical protein